MIALIDYEGGNVASVLHALQRTGAGEIAVTADPALIRSADKVLLPGVGDASVALASLRAKGLDTVLRSLTRPVLGICVGMQLLCGHTEEGDADGLGVFRTQVRRFPQEALHIKVPHIGWNTLSSRSSALFDGLADPAFVYYVHSYYAELCPDTAARTEHGLAFSAALVRDNFFGVQFHPEKSGPAGGRILRNFLSL